MFSARLFVQNRSSQYLPAFPGRFNIPADAWRIVGSFLAIYFIWGSTYLAIRFATDTIPPFMMSACRFFAAGAILFACTYRRNSGLTWSTWRDAAIVGILLICTGNGAAVALIASKAVPSGMMSVLSAMVPVYMVLLDKPTAALQNKWLMLGLLSGMLGIIGLSLHGAFSLNARAGYFTVGIAAFASLSWAYGSLYARRADAPPSTLLFTAMQMLCGSVGLIAASAATGEFGNVHYETISWQSILSLAYLVVFGSIIGFGAYTFLLKRVSACKVATVSYVNPIVAVLLGCVLGGEALTSETMLSGALILSAVISITGANAAEN